MDYAESLLELIKSKRSLSRDGVIGISLGEIISAWNTHSVVHENSSMLSPFTTSHYIERGFLEDIVSALEKLIAEKKVTFEKLGRPGLLNSVSSIRNLWHIGDRIYLKMGEAAEETDIDKAKNKSLSLWLTFYTEDNIKLEFNTKTGDFKFGEVKGNLVPDTQPFKVFLALLEDDGHQVKDIPLLKMLYPNKIEFSKIDRWGLNEILRNIKTELGILPERKAKNKTIFRRLKNWQGYKLDLKTGTE